MYYQSISTAIKTPKNYYKVTYMDFTSNPRPRVGGLRRSWCCYKTGERPCIIFPTRQILSILEHSYRNSKKLLNKTPRLAYIQIRVLSPTGRGDWGGPGADICPGRQLQLIFFVMFISPTNILKHIHK